jgi:hypothetical protein
LWGGDFNLPDIDWTGPNIAGSLNPKRVNQAFLNMIADNNLEQQVTFPTRKDNTLDLIMTSHPSYKIRCKPLPSIGNSDHDVVLYDSALAPSRKKNQRRKILLWKNAKMEEIKSDIRSYIPNEDHRDANAAWIDFKSMLTTTIQQHVPTKMTQPRSSLPWMTEKLKRAIKRKQKAHRKARTTKKKRDRDRYRRLQQEVRFMIRESNDQYMAEVVSENQQGNRKRFWSYVKGKRQENTGVSPLKDSEGYIKSDSRSKAEILNHQFHSVYTQENTSNIPDMGRQRVPIMESIHVTNNGVLKLLRDLDPHKAAGPDEVPPYILKAAAEEIAPILTGIFQKSLDTGIVPQDWKDATIVPAFKKGDKHLASNYRPISLTSISCKVMEHIIHSSVMRHFDNYSVLTDNQHGFRKRRSCETQLIVTLDEITRNYANGHQVDVILLDFAKAFDKVPHKKLLHKLRHYGVSDNVLRWIQNFLGGRTQKVVVDGADSGRLPVLSGVPQGTVLGPLLFLAYINDLQDWTKHSNARLFADDSLLFRTIRSTKDELLLQEDLTRLEEWEKSWEMKFNPSKCTVIQIAPGKGKLLKTEYELHGEIISTSDCSKYLGVSIKNNLAWDTHIQGITGKANRNLGFLRRNFRSCSQAVKQETYTTMVRSTLEYAAAVWDPSQVSLINQMEQKYNAGLLDSLITTTANAAPAVLPEC